MKHEPIDHNRKFEESKEFYDAAASITAKKSKELNEQTARRIKQLEDQGEDIKYADE